MKDSRYINVKHISLYVNDISLFRATFKLKDVSDNIKEIQIVHISKDLCLIPEETNTKIPHTKWWRACIALFR